MKTCNKCKIPKEEKEFYKNSHSSDGLKSICKTCTSVSAKNYYDNNIEQVKEYSRNHHLINKEENNKRNRERFHKNPELKRKQRLRPYKITQDQFDILMEVSGYKCNICSLSQKDNKLIFKKDLSIDHCHKTGQVRGILCTSCNLGLGYFKDNRSLLNKATKYLEKWQQQEIWYPQ